MGSPHFDLADVLIIPTTCDGNKKLAEIMADRKQTWVIEVPHTQETPQARHLWLTEIKLLKSQLEKLTGKKITSKKLRAAIELVNRRRAAARRSSGGCSHSWDGKRRRGLSSIQRHPKRQERGRRQHTHPNCAIQPACARRSQGHLRQWLHAERCLPAASRHHIPPDPL